MGFGIMEMLFPIFFILTFTIVIATFCSVIYREIKRQRYNHRSPELTVAAGLVSKRSNTVHHQDHMSHTYYYLTFEFESGDRLELAVDGETYGIFVEGDVGRLTFKGTEFIDFKRE